MPDEAWIPYRIVVDTNVIIRGILSPTGASAEILNAIRRRNCLLLSSREHLGEIYRVLRSPRLARRYGITSQFSKRIVARLYALAIFVRPVTRLAVCRDPHDDYLIEIALLGRAAYLVSEDNDLHDDGDIATLLREWGVELIHAGDFARKLSSRPIP